MKLKKPISSMSDMRQKPNFMVLCGLPRPRLYRLSPTGDTGTYRARAEPAGPAPANTAGCSGKGFNQIAAARAGMAGSAPCPPVDFLLATRRPRRSFARPRLCGRRGQLSRLPERRAGRGARRRHPPRTLDRAFAGIAPNQKVLERDRHQPEFTMTWARYRALVITDKRITDGRQAVAANRALFQRVEQRYGVGAGVIAGIWGLESSFGTGTGDFRVVEALATLAWEGRRASFFRGELMAALKILDHGDVAPQAMTGSYAGAMGQPQFMPIQLSALCGRLRGPRTPRHLDQQARRAGLDRQLPGAVRLARRRRPGARR